MFIFERKNRSKTEKNYNYNYNTGQNYWPDVRICVKIGNNEKTLIFAFGYFWPLLQIFFFSSVQTGYYFMFLPNDNTLLIFLKVKVGCITRLQNLLYLYDQGRRKIWYNLRRLIAHPLPLLRNLFNQHIFYIHKNKFPRTVSLAFS